MEPRICLPFLFILFNIAECQKCPSYWYGYSDVSKCYRFMFQNKLSWKDARDLCQIHGGDLLKIDTVQERNWIFGQIQNLKTHARIPSDNWWVGLNDREYLNAWEWADGSPAASNILNWAQGEPNNVGGDERCGEINNGRFSDETCTDPNRYVCSRDRSIPLKCDSDHGWQTTNGYCYKVYAARANWYNAKQRCEHDGGALVTIGSENEEIIMHDFALNFKQQLWIGLYSLQQPGNQVKWLWTNQTQLSFSYWHGTPHVDSHHLNNSCAVVSNSVSNIQAWSVQPCAQSKAFVCKKPEGVCFPGWIGYQTYCYQFDVQYRLSFNDAANYCQRQGAELLRYTGDSAKMFINSYLQEMRDSGAQDFWIGASDNNHDAGPYKWRNGQAVTYKLWAAAHNTPTNTKGRQDCAFVSTSDRSGKWRTTTNCRAQKPFVCLIPMGRSVRPIPRTPRPQYGCPPNWRQYSGQCYRIFDQAVDWPAARTRCQQTTGADLVAIKSVGVQNFINHMIHNGVQYWIGLNDRKVDGSFVWNDETTPIVRTAPVILNQLDPTNNKNTPDCLSGMKDTIILHVATFTSWNPHEPSNSGHQENCVVQRNTGWNDVVCSTRNRYICSKDANSVLPPTSPTPAVDWTLKCGPGWESNPVTSSCYKFVDEPLSWVDALNQCQQFHGNLVTIETLEEQNYLAGRIQSMNSIGLWIGANDRGTEGGWRWSSGKPFAFLNWAAGNPGAHGQGTDCVVMFTRNARWDDIDCNQRNGYVCEKIGNIPTTRPPPTTALRIPAGMTLGCRPGWKPYGTNCFFFGRQKTNWLNAQISCGHLGGHLASIQNRNEQHFIASNLWRNPKDRYDGVYIGLNDRTSESRFTWDDGSNVMYTNWGDNEPNSFMNHNEDCVEMKLNNGYWNDEVCTTIKSGYVCKTPKSIVSATQNPYQIGCPLYSLGYNSYCYKIVSGNAKSWNDANTFCNRTFHGTLATVNDRYLQSFLSSQLLYRTGYFWLGMTDRARPGTYSWASGDPVQFTYWHNTHTGNERSTCVGMRADQPIGLWENLGCNTKNNYICQFPRKGGFSTLPTTPTPFPNVHCPSGWTANQGQCYFVFSNPSQRLTWMDAVTFCRGLGGDLPSFHSSQNDSFLQTLIPKFLGYRLLWIGLNDRDTEDGYQWSDGSAVDYTNWKSDEPNNYRGNEDCVVYITSSHNWNDMNCYATTEFICAIPRGTTLPASTVVPTPARSSQCGSDSNWYFYNNNCYMFNPSSGPNATLTWYDASDYCNGVSANLASIHTPDENGFLQGILHQMPFWEVWTGFNELGLSGYSWADLTPVDFTNWRPNEPNDAFGGERCVKMVKSGEWNDNNCGLKKGYICKKPASGHIMIPSPSPYPSGGCANGFTRVPGGRNKCFYLNKSKQNWTSARDQCQRFGKGYDIASVEDLYEQEYFLAMASKVYSNVWIGLTDKQSNNKWLWQDNSPVVYTNWDTGEPTSSHSQANNKDTQNCVALRMYKGHIGKWADVDCDQTFMSLCQAKQDPNLQMILPPNSCRKGYKPYQNGCYKLSSDVKTWNDAKAACQADRGQLTSITNVNENGFVVTLGSSGMPFWIGLSDSLIPGLYGWADGWPVKFTNWGYREPSYDNGGCVLVNKNGRWNDTNCGRQLHYICKISSVKPPKTTPTPPGNCANSKWIPNGDYCYSVSVNQGRSWPEANYQCQKNGMKLVSVHSKAEMDFIFNLIKQAKVFNPQYKPNIFIGLAKGPQGSFAWSDGSAVNYLNWNPGQPTGLGTHGQLEECVEVDRTTGKWNDVSFFKNRGYICKALKVFKTTPLAQTINPAIIGSSAFPPVTLSNGSLAAPGSNSAQQQQKQTKDSSSGLSRGGIAGVAIGCVISILLVALLLFLLKTKGVVKAPRLERSSSGESGFDNALYNKGSNGVKIDSDA